jgi:hypothetical protein
MNGETGFLHSFGAVGCRGSKGSSPWGAHLRATNLYSVGWLDPDHDAVMRIGGKAPGGGPILTVGISAMFEYGFPPSRIVNSAIVLKGSASAEWC